MQVIQLSFNEISCDNTIRNILKLNNGETRTQPSVYKLNVWSNNYTYNPTTIYQHLIT